MGTLYERIIDLCKRKGVSGSRMCIDLSLSKSTLSDMKYGRTKGVSMKTAQKIADYFGITVDELYGLDGKEEKENPSHSAKIRNPAAATVAGFFLYFQWFAGFYIAFVRNKII